jgi:aminoglycoside 6'-N-acetyltransferase
VVSLRAATEDDIPAILAYLAEPEVAAWWGSNTADDVRQELEQTRVIIVDGEVAGHLLCHEETEPDYRSVAFDIAIATRFHGTGVGRAALRQAIRGYIARGHHRFTIDPTVGNEKAIRSYSAVGFKPIGIGREAERGPDGVWRDSLLMDLLAREFVDAD